MANEAATTGVFNEPDTTRIARDARSDDGHRRVVMNARRVLIERKVRGISMRVGIPTKAYVGVVLSIEDGARERVYRVWLSHRDCDLSITLATGDAESGLAEWRKWSRYFGLPCMVERHDGAIVTVAETRESLDVVLPASRRRNGLLAKRRPRFCTRRLVGNATSPRHVFAGEREIICYE